MKTAGYYFAYLIKVMAFIIFMMWLCSGCADRTKQAIRVYQDSLVNAQLQAAYIDMRKDSALADFLHKYPARAFHIRDTCARYAYAREVHIAYDKYLAWRDSFDLKYRYIRNNYAKQIDHYQSIIDSLKIYND